jgi:hypothetical protein
MESFLILLPFNFQNLLKPAAGHVTIQQDGFRTSRTARNLAGQQKSQQDGYIYRQDGRKVSRTTISTSRTAENSAGRRHRLAGQQKSQQGESGRAIRRKKTQQIVLIYKHNPLLLKRKRRAAP